MNELHLFAGAAIGNGQVPAVAHLAWEILSQ